MGTWQATLRIGTSGWSYDHWDGVLYRRGLPVAERLARYVEVFDTVELNASFYRWPQDATFRGWHRRLPKGFTMSVKAHRGLSHFRRLRNPQPWVDRIQSCQRALGDTREAVLVQLHPGLPRDDTRLQDFLRLIPDWIRIAIEARHPSWNDPQVYDILRHHHAAYVVTSGPGMRCNLCATTDLVYIRMHGPATAPLYAGSYTTDDLKWWADRIREWQQQGRRVLMYFNNDGNGYAVRNARELRSLLAG